MLKEKISGKKSLMFEVLLFGKENNTGADINEKSYRIIFPVTLIACLLFTISFFSFLEDFIIAKINNLYNNSQYL